MFWRALFAFLALPGLVAFVVPLLMAGTRGPAGPMRALGLVTLVTGSLLLLRCVRDFYVAGKGTLAPWSPPRHLVTIGLYRHCRNPMYVAVLVILVGWAVYFSSAVLSFYAALVAVAFHARVVLGEEPWLARTHGESWRRYAARVPRWVPRMTGRR